MSRQTVLDQVQSMVGDIAGVRTVTQGEPEEIPATDLPLCVLELTPTQSEQLTFDDASHAGTRHDTYEVVMTLYLGLPTMQKKRATEDAVPYPERFVTSFMGDRTLGGTCWFSWLGSPEENIVGGVYRLAGSWPYLRWRLRVTEQTTMAA